MSVILVLVGIFGIALTCLLFYAALTNFITIGVAIMLPTALVGILLSFLLIGIGELLRATRQIERRLESVYFR
jgi:hypothetical protein